MLRSLSSNGFKGLAGELVCLLGIAELNMIEEQYGRRIYAALMGRD